VGFAPVFANKWGFDIYAGFGIRMLYNEYLNVQNVEDSYEEALVNKAQWEGLRLGGNISSGLKFFYLF